MPDDLKQYVQLRAALATEKTRIEQRLTAIEDALFGEVARPLAPKVSVPAKKRGPKPKGSPIQKATVTPAVEKPTKLEKAAKKTPTTGRGRGGNAMSLKEAITKVTRKKALSKAEILTEIDQIGYQFTTNKPQRCLDNALYTKGLFKKVNGKFRAV